MEQPERTYGTAHVHTYDDREEMGKAAADHVARLIGDILKRKERVNIVFAAAPSQNEFLAHLVKSKSVDWSRVVGFHMDEYLGLPAASDQFFSLYLKKHLFSKVRIKTIHFLDSQPKDPFKECERYSALLRENPTDIVCLGIGENGHIAFNDPPFADFHDKKLVKIVELDEADRRQQVNDGCFPTIKAVPPSAFTLTIPALMSAAHLSCVVPSERKAKAVMNALTGEISTAVPASILRTHPQIEMFLDKASASLLP
jgi:glucosamine-6-phosphate deaminase